MCQWNRNHWCDCCVFFLSDNAGRWWGWKKCPHNQVYSKPLCWWVWYGCNHSNSYSNQLIIFVQIQQLKTHTASNFISFKIIFQVWVNWTMTTTMINGYMVLLDILDTGVWSLWCVFEWPLTWIAAGPEEYSAMRDHVNNGTPTHHTTHHMTTQLLIIWFSTWEPLKE